MFLVLAICAAPLIASYFTYYVIKPTSRNNYGELIDPRNYPIPQLQASALDGAPASFDAYKGKWIMLQVDGGDCKDPCRRKLLDMRQLRLMQGKEMERIERVWLVTDDNPIDTIVLREFDGTRIMRANRDVVNAWLPVAPGMTPAEYIYLIDPLGNLMMRFPKQPDSGKMKKDIAKLLKASGIG